MKKLILAFTAVSLSAACGGGGAGTGNNTHGNSAPAQTPAISKPADSPTPNDAQMPQIPKDGTYKGHGVVTRVSNDLGSIEIDHDAIPNMMPAMKMEFYVKDKAMLDGIYANDEINFVIEYKHPEEKIISIKKIRTTTKDPE